MPDSRSYVDINREHWTAANKLHTDQAARSAWTGKTISWGQWHIEESEVRALPDVAGKDVIELGCGTAYFGAWLKQRGAERVVGVDITPAQLTTAARLNEEFRLGLELVEASAESVPLADEQFDLVISEFGASIWCDPVLWIAEAARLLRSGGELVFLRNTTLTMLWMPDAGKVSTTLQRPQQGMYRLEWDDDNPAVEFHPPTGSMLRILLDNGFEVLDIIELYPGADAVDHPFYTYVGVEWARQWAAEEIWKARLRQ